MGDYQKIVCHGALVCGQELKSSTLVTSLLATSPPLYPYTM